MCLGHGEEGSTTRTRQTPTLHTPKRDAQLRNFPRKLKRQQMVHLHTNLLPLDVTRVIESVDHKHERCCYVPGTALPTWTLGLGTEGLVSK